MLVHATAYTNLQSLITSDGSVSRTIHQIAQSV